MCVCTHICMYVYIYVYTHESSTLIHAWKTEVRVTHISLIVSLFLLETLVNIYARVRITVRYDVTLPINRLFFDSFDTLYFPVV